MPRTYIYRFRRTSWGIYIELTAEVVPLVGNTGEAHEAAPGLWLVLPEGSSVHPDEVRYLLVGLRLVAGQLEETIQRTGSIVVSIVDRRYNPTDYLDEGMAYAIAGWVAEEYGFPFVGPPIEWDRVDKQYRFAFPEDALRP